MSNSYSLIIFFLLIEQLQPISEDLARPLKKKPGQILCSSCSTKKAEKKREASEAEEYNNDKEYLPSPNPKKALNQSVEILGCSPLRSVSQHDKISYGKRKVSQVYVASAELIADVLDVSTDDITFNKSVNNAECCQKATDCDKLMESVKEKIGISSRQENIKLLTLVPPSWTIKDLSSYFGVPESMIKKARKLKSEKGLLAEPNKKLGKKISEDMLKCILDFYQSDKYF